MTTEMELETEMEMERGIRNRIAFSSGQMGPRLGCLLEPCFWLLSEDSNVNFLPFFS